jgi:Uma2 family endonuclease
VAPDWVCEILSPGTALVDRGDKMPIYARHEVRYAWLIEPALKSLEVFRLESGRWSLLGTYGGKKRVRVEPFQAIEIDLQGLWTEAVETPAPAENPPESYTC